MTYSLPATVSHSFRPYQAGPAPASAARHSYHAAADYYTDAPMQSTTTYRRRVDEPMPYAKHSVSASAVAASSSSQSSSSSFSPLSLCSSVSSCSSSSSGSSSSAYTSPADTFDLEEMGEDNIPHAAHHPYYTQHPHQPQHSQHHRHTKPGPPPQGKPGRPMAQPQLHHQAPQDTVYYPPQAIPAAASPQHVYGHTHSPPPSMTVSIPAANGGWKDLPRRREAPSAHSLVPAELPAYMPAPVQPVVAAAAEVMVDGKGSSGGKKKKGRSLRRCMDREKHSKAEQKRRGEMKLLFDQLQDISQCVYKDRIHILTLAIQTIQRQQETINQLSQVPAKDGKARSSKAIKREQSGADSNGAAIVASGCSSPASSGSHGESVSSKSAAVAAELDCEPVTVVKQEQEDCEPSHMPSPKKQRTSPHPRDVVDLSTEAAFGASLPPPVLHDHPSSTVSALATTSYVSKPLHNSFSSSSLSTFVCSSADTQGAFPYLLDEQPHTQYHPHHADDSVVVSSKTQSASHHGHAHHAPNPNYHPTPCMSPVFSFTAHPQQWWPSTAESTKH